MTRAPVSPEKLWIARGLRLSRSARSIMWQLGDWWNNPPEGTNRVEVVASTKWERGGGLNHGTCRTAGWVAERWPVSSRLDTLTFEHHAAVAALPDAQAVPLLEWAGREGKTREELRTRVKQLRRDAREVELAEAIEEQTHLLGVQRFGVIYADPPWQFEPYSRETGMDRAAENHYPTMTQDALAALELPAGEDCVLFCWTTVAMLPAGMAFLSDHGFTYRSAYFWHKPGAGTGYWSTTDQIEILLVGTVGNPPAPAPGKQPPQI
jgi:hypothetical protein